MKGGKPMYKGALAHEMADGTGRKDAYMARMEGRREGKQCVFGHGRVGTGMEPKKTQAIAGLCRKDARDARPGQAGGKSSAVAAASLRDRCIKDKSGCEACPEFVGSWQRAP